MAVAPFKSAYRTDHEGEEQGENVASHFAVQGREDTRDTRGAGRGSD